MLGRLFRYGRESVPHACYFELFDALQGYIETSVAPVPGRALEQTLAHDPRCGSVSKITVADDRKYVSEWRPEEILRFIGAGDRVVFVDTRETGEFEEGHIPGAINLYCVKDFRGFEVAKRLHLRYRF